MKKIIMTGGGTAGHVTPNIALIPGLRKKGYDIVYIGSYNGMERRLIENMGITYFGISSGKLRRYFDWENFLDPFKVCKGFVESVRIIKKEKPKIVFSKGGFVSVPVVLAAKFCGVPAIIHESDITPGLANKIAIRGAKKVCWRAPHCEMTSKTECVASRPHRKMEAYSILKKRFYAILETKTAEKQICYKCSTSHANRHQTGSKSKDSI